MASITFDLVKEQVNGYVQSQLENQDAKHRSLSRSTVFTQITRDSTNLKVSRLRNLKSTKNQEILQSLKNGSSVNTETRYYVSLPINAAHNGVRHTGRARGMSQRVDPLVSKFVEEIVRGGTTDVDTVQKLLKSRISIELKHSLPDVMDRTFNPTKDDIRNHIHCAMRAIELSKFDQENLQKKVNVEQSLSTRKQYFRPFIKSSDSAEVEEQFSQRLLGCIKKIGNRSYV